MRRSRHRRSSVGKDLSRRRVQPLPRFHPLDGERSGRSPLDSCDIQQEPKSAAPNFLEFLAGVIRDWNTTFRLAFLVGVTAGALGGLVQFVKFEDQWVWVLFSALGVGGVAKLRQWRESSRGDPR